MADSDEKYVHDHEHTHTYTHAHPHTHEDGSIDDGHTHEHTHTYTHTHPHEHTPGEEDCHDHPHDHEHPYDHEHEHQPHHHHHEHGEEKPAAQVYALMRYMAGHNADHIRELAELSGQVRETAGQEAYDLVLEAVKLFEQGNAALFKALEKLPD